MSTMVFYKGPGQWIHFTLPEYCTHKDGYTLYKVIGFRQTLTDNGRSATVYQFHLWERYSRFLNLHKTVKDAYTGSLTLPSLWKPSTFGRFSNSEILQRQKSLEVFFDYIAQFNIPCFSQSVDDFFIKSQNISESFMNNANQNLSKADQPGSGETVYADHRAARDVEEHDSENYRPFAEEKHSETDEFEGSSSVSIEIRPSIAVSEALDVATSSDPDVPHGGSKVVAIEVSPEIYNEDDAFEAWLSRKQMSEDSSSATSLSLEVPSETSSLSGGANSLPSSYTELHQSTAFYATQILPRKEQRGHKIRILK